MTCNCPTCGHTLPPDLASIDWDAGIIVSGGRFTALTASEFALFTELYNAKGQIRSKDQLLNAVSSFIDDAPEVKIVDVYVCKIRKKLTGLAFQISTIWGEGYRLMPIEPESR